MTPRSLMIVGATTGVFSLFLAVLGAQPTSGTVVVVFIAGALFGKGYGVWEERQ